MYLIGQDAGKRAETAALLDNAIRGRQRLVTSAEVFQEILHRYTAINRRDAIQPAFDVLQGVVDEVFAIDLDQVQRARLILLERPRLSSRDALHIATMERHRITEIMSFDAGFDRVPGITRHPAP